MKRNMKPRFDPRKEAFLVRKDLTNLYTNKYLSLYIDSAYGENLTDEQVRFSMRQFWTKGSVSIVKVEGTEGSTEYPDGAPLVAPFSVDQWNIYEMPIKVRQIALKPTPLINPARVFEVNKDIVLLWGHKSHMPVYSLVRPLIDKMVDVEMVIRMNLKAQKMPWLVAVTPETETKMRELASALEQDDPALFVELSEADKAQALISGAPMILDALYNYKSALDGEIREVMGFSNLGFNEKKEHLLNGEINANNQVTDSFRGCFDDELEEGSERVRKYLGMKAGLHLKQPVITIEETEKENEEPKEGKDDDNQA